MQGGIRGFDMSLAATCHGSKQDLLLSGASALSMGGYSYPQSWGTLNRSCPLQGPRPNTP